MDITPSAALFMSKELPQAYGLNQLAMRNVGEQLFNRLLPGLNNVSSRIRYYSFYCWLFQQYFNSGIDVSRKSFCFFLKKAEYLLALINYNKEGIPGTTYALKQRNEGLKEYDLEEGQSKFWANAGGIFGAYYANSLGDLGITGSLSNEKGEIIWVYNCRNDVGRQLAAAFGTSIGNKAKRFVEIVKAGNATDTELLEFLPEFDMLNFSEQAAQKEKQLLTDMIFGRDKDPEIDANETFRRRDTLCKILRYAGGNTGKRLNDLDFVDYAFKQFMQSPDNRHADDWGWWAYAVNEEWQMSSSIIFADLLDTFLRDEFHGDWERVEVVVALMSQRLAEQLQLDLDGTLSDALVPICLSEQQNKKSGAEGLRRLLKLYYEQREIITDLSDFESYFPALWQDSFSGFCKKIKGFEEKQLSAFLKYLLTEEIILRHYREAFRKMNATNIDTHKLAVENGCVRYLASVPATHSQPRVGTAIGFLRDLGLVDKEQRTITEAGLVVLKRYGHD